MKLLIALLIALSGSAPDVIPATRPTIPVVGGSASSVSGNLPTLSPTTRSGVLGAPQTPRRMDGSGVRTALVARRAIAATRIGRPMIGGWISYADRQHGRFYLAMRLPRGTVVRICGPGGCLRRVVNDYGPKASIRPIRIADVSYLDWLFICGQKSHLHGKCRGSAIIFEKAPQLPATDTAP
jgi:hypothetical protein